MGREPRSEGQGRAIPELKLHTCYAFRSIFILGSSRSGSRWKAGISGDKDAEHDGDAPMTMISHSDGNGGDDAGDDIGSE